VTSAEALWPPEELASEPIFGSAFAAGSV